MDRAGEPGAGGEPFGEAERGVVRKAAEFLTQAGREAAGDGDNALSLALPNGSRIVGLPGTEATVRGFSAVSMLLIDEAARVEDAVYKSLRPMLAVGNGDLWLMSTPWGQRGFFYEAWTHGGDAWERHSAAATECPRIRAEFLEEERREMGVPGSRRSICASSWITGGMVRAGVVEGALSLDEPLWL